MHYDSGKIRAIHGNLFLLLTHTKANLANRQTKNKCSNANKLISCPSLLEFRWIWLSWEFAFGAPHLLRARTQRVYKKLNSRKMFWQISCLMKRIHNSIYKFMQYLFYTRIATSDTSHTHTRWHSEAEKETIFPLNSWETITIKSNENSMKLLCQFPCQKHSVSPLPLCTGAR